MRKRALAWVVLLAFSVFSWSCAYTWKKMPLQSGLQPDKIEEARISAVQTKSGEKIDLNKDPAARIQLNAVVGERFSKNIPIEKSKIENPKKLPHDYPFLLTTTDGNTYRVTDWVSSGNKIILSGYVPFDMLISEIDLVWVRKLDITALIVNLMAPVAIIIAVVAIGSPKEFGHIM